MRRILLLHVCLLVLAVTRFTIATSAFVGGFPRWSFVTFVSQNGFGYKYASPFSLPVVLTYIAAYTVGLVGFTLALKRGSSIVGTLGAAMSVLGLVSFLIEGSHWAIEHNRSWLAFSPAAMFVLSAIALRPRRIGAPAQTGPERQPA